MKIRARAPLRVSFAGGGTDIEPYTDMMGGVVLSSTIRSYSYCSITPRTDSIVTISQENDATNVNRFVKAVASRFDALSGYDVSLRYDALPGTGLGSSSALCVSLIGAFKQWLGGFPMDDYYIANLACEIERKDLGIFGGMQDQYASTFGGFNFIEFRNGEVIVNPLRIKSETIDEIEYNSILCFTGISRISSGLIKRQMESYVRKDAKVFSALAKMKELTFQMKDHLLTGDLVEFAKLLSAEWDLKRTLDKGIPTYDVDRFVSVARNMGAIGTKLLGAGGGGFLFLYCDSGKQVKVQNAMRAMGGETYPVRFDKDGLQTWSQL